MSASRFLCSRCMALLFAFAFLMVISSAIFRIMSSSSGVALTISSPVSFDNWENIPDSVKCFMSIETVRSCGPWSGGVGIVAVVVAEGVAVLVEGEA